jgi:hypothetical protein
LSGGSFRQGFFTFWACPGVKGRVEARLSETAAARGQRAVVNVNLSVRLSDKTRRFTQCVIQSRFSALGAIKGLPERATDIGFPMSVDVTGARRV